MSLQGKEGFSFFVLHLEGENASLPFLCKVFFFEKEEDGGGVIGRSVTPLRKRKNLDSKCKSRDGRGRSGFFFFSTQKI